VAVILFFYARDKHEREPFGVLLVSFLWGCFSVVPAIILESILPGIIPGSGGSSLTSIAIYTFVIIAFSEELSKFTFLRYYSYKKRSFNEPFDGIIYAVMVGMGFATVENLLYVFGAETLGAAWGTAGLRALTAVPAHATFAAVMGYYVGLAKFSKTHEKRYLLQGLLLATILHGFYDFFLFQNLSVGLYIGAFISLILGIRYSLRAIKLHNAASPFNAENTIAVQDEAETQYESPYKPEE
ncbi:MAG: PrsW family intramembrane metalloprotease, partial [Sediminibacterium sp.]